MLVHCVYYTVLFISVHRLDSFQCFTCLWHAQVECWFVVFITLFCLLAFIDWIAFSASHIYDTYRLNFGSLSLLHCFSVSHNYGTFWFNAGSLCLLHCFVCQRSSPRQLQCFTWLWYAQVECWCIVFIILFCLLAFMDSVAFSVSHIYDTHRLNVGPLCLLHWLVCWSKQAFIQDKIKIR